MKTHRSTTFRVRATPAKFRTLFAMASACRFVWNWATRQNRLERQLWELDRPYMDDPSPSLTFFTWSGRFTKLRRETPWLAELPSKPIRATLRRWSQSWSQYFDKKHPQTGRPAFHRRDHKLWVDFPGNSARMAGKWLRLCGVGWVRLSGSAPYAGAKVVSVHLGSEDGWRWYATVGYEVELAEPADNGKAVGVDMNCGQVALSTGDILRAPDVTRLDARRKRYQRRMARAKPGSNRRQRWKERAAKASRAIANRRKDWHHRTSRALADTAGLVVIEDLAAAKMTRRGKGKRGLNREILATGWGDLRRMIEYKAAHVVAVDPRNTSRTCNACGHVDAGNRKTQADFECLECGHAGNADINAALNILARGRGATGRRPALALATGTTRQPSPVGIAA